METTQYIEVNIGEQHLILFNKGQERARYPVSTAVKGPGELKDSGCTPRGVHRVRLVIGQGCPEGSVFVGRRFTGEIYSRDLGKSQPERAWILSRVIWLTGNETGFNRGGSCDSLRRFIYIHGTPDSEPMGEPHSHGCIRMRNRDVIELAEQIERGTVVRIME